MSVNKVILLGNVGRDPDIRYVAQGRPVATFSLATTERGFTNSNGVQVPERTEWHNIVMWGRNAEVAEKYIRKGTQLFIEGQLRTRMWEDRNAIKHYVTEIHVDNFELLGRPKTEAGPQQPVAQPQQPVQQPVQPQQPVQQQLPTEPPF
ncbi:MAG: single-stranded DNA-binding protein [Muribaculaceae bacterium]|nr:single-stranded DNA-binding protein [Muribaculaceae bacterium]MBR6431312.1 single-stranded DNA-binding protein [Muribaculaceae bacterium]